ncbi:hypothetical protein [Paenibacillus koleovorans]|uniref:hypothetical protein n=1 Tax=Paenibacillus koleovorans TaxID=121608 RepID=UPI000FD6EF1F|nr:hypothetical protein [Paenibacillus koleovorans]
MTSIPFTKAEQVWPIRPVQWDAIRKAELSNRYLNMLLRWVPYADSTFEEWPGRPNCGHFFGGCHGYGTDTSCPAALYAVLAKIGEFDEETTGISRKRLKTRAIQGIRYLGFTHGSGPEDCVRPLSHNPANSGLKWGRPDEDCFRATQTGNSIAALGIAAQFLWDDLGDEEKLMVQTIVASYADRWCEVRPRSGVYNDTQEEENAWTANGISVAMNLFPDHPNAEKWKTGFIRWALNSVVSYKDCYIQEKVLPAKTRRTSSVEIPPFINVTLHADYTTENHGFVHPDYLKAGINLRASHLVQAWIGGAEALSCALYNNEEIYEQVILKCIQADGFGIPVQGQDWYYNKQHESLFTHAVMNVVHEHPDAALIERDVLSRMEKVQLSHSSGCLVEENSEDYWLTPFQSLKHVEPLNMLSLLKSFLLHSFGGDGTPPSDREAFHRRMEGVHHYPYGSFIIHKTKRAFSAFNWRSNVLALTLPESGIWSLTPMLNNYVGTIEFETSNGVKGLTNETRVRHVERDHVLPHADGFGVCTTIPRGDRELLQHVAFVSLPDGRTVYLEQFHAVKPCRIKHMHTGILGVRNEHYRQLPDVAKGYRTMYGSDGTVATFEGMFGGRPDERYAFGPVPYLNLDQQIGFQVFGSAGMQYWNRHEFPKYTGVENSIVLNAREQVVMEPGASLPPLTVFTLPNRTLDETARHASETVQLDCSDPQATVFESQGCLVYAFFGDLDRTVTAARPLTLGHGDRLAVYEGNNRIVPEAWMWSGRLGAFSSGYLTKTCSITVQLTGGLPANEASPPAWSLDVAVLADRILLTNGSPKRLLVQLFIQGESESHQSVELGPQSFATVPRG